MPEPDPVPSGRTRRRFRPTVRALMVAVLIVGGPGWIIHRARVQREAVAAIERSGGGVCYHNLEPADAPDPPWTPWREGRRWVRHRLGVDYVDGIGSIAFGQELDAEAGKMDALAPQVARLGRVNTLSYLGGLSDVGLARLAGLRVDALLRTRVSPSR